jgi:hypothetical protein
MVIERLKQTVGAPCAPQSTNRHARGGGVDQNWQCLAQQDVSQLRQWLRTLGLHPDPHVNAPNCKSKDDSCVLDTLSKLTTPRPQNNVAKTLSNKRLVPRAPSSWAKKPTTWLTTPEFGVVMRQYEAAYPEFEFLGASPIDFDKPYDKSNTCVWPRICKFTIKKAIEKGKTKIGFVFNEDDHKSAGSHWICAYMDIAEGAFYFIDSVGNPTPAEIVKLTNRLDDEYQALHGRPLVVHANTMPHQRGDNQCGMYCLFFIISLLTRAATYEELTKKRIPDSAMADMRKVLFRRPTPTGQQQPSGDAKQGGGTTKRRRRRGRTSGQCKRRGRSKVVGCRRRSTRYIRRTRRMRQTRQTQRKRRNTRTLRR